MIRYETENSLYEVDDQKKMIRRLHGTAEPTPRIGTDGEWRPYQDYAQTDVGLVVVWPWINDNGTVPTTITSKVVKVTWNSKEDPR